MKEHFNTIQNLRLQPVDSNLFLSFYIKQQEITSPKSKLFYIMRNHTLQNLFALLHTQCATRVSGYITCGTCDWHMILAK